MSLRLQPKEKPVDKVETDLEKIEIDRQNRLIEGKNYIFIQINFFHLYFFKEIIFKVDINYYIYQRANLPSIHL